MANIVNNKITIRNTQLVGQIAYAYAKTVTTAFQLCHSGAKPSHLTSMTHKGMVKLAYRDPSTAQNFQDCIEKEFAPMKNSDIDGGLDR